VVVGAGTARMDDPLLTAREVDHCRQPLRVVVGRAENLPAESALVRSVAEGPVLVIGGDPTADEAAMRLRESGVEVVTVACGSDGRPEPRAVAQFLAARGVQTLLLEGGRRLAGGWWEAGIIDKVACFLCPKVAPGTEHRGALLTTGPALMGDAVALREVEVRQCGADVLMTGYTGDAY
jgi:diaminohydroxyphosphoribosylaminopyrimidine deaminase / 5-amino-6-(5-phosphoribosylamino)uracil reductase